MMEDESASLDGKGLLNMRVVDLKLELEKRGLSKSGSKKDLVKRLKQQLEFEKLCEERKSADFPMKLELDAETEQNEFVQQYLAQQQKRYAERQEQKRLELEAMQQSLDEGSAISSEDQREVDENPSPDTDDEKQKLIDKPCEKESQSEGDIEVDYSKSVESYTYKDSNISECESKTESFEKSALSPNPVVVCDTDEKNNFENAELNRNKSAIQNLSDISETGDTKLSESRSLSETETKNFIFSEPKRETDNRVHITVGSDGAEKTKHFEENISSQSYDKKDTKVSVETGANQNNPSPTSEVVGLSASYSVSAEKDPSKDIPRQKSSDTMEISDCSVPFSLSDIQLPASPDHPVKSKDTKYDEKNQIDGASDEETDKNSQSNIKNKSNGETVRELNSSRENMSESETKDSSYSNDSPEKIKPTKDKRHSASSSDEDSDRNSSSYKKKSFKYEDTSLNLAADSDNDQSKIASNKKQYVSHNIRKSDSEESTTSEKSDGYKDSKNRSLEKRRKRDESTDSEKSDDHDDSKHKSRDKYRRKNESTDSEKYDHREVSKHKSHDKSVKRDPSTDSEKHNRHEDTKHKSHKSVKRDQTTDSIKHSRHEDSKRKSRDKSIKRDQGTDSEKHNRHEESKHKSHDKSGKKDPNTDSEKYGHHEDSKHKSSEKSKKRDESTDSEKYDHHDDSKHKSRDKSRKRDDSTESKKYDRHEDSKPKSRDKHRKQDNKRDKRKTVKSSSSRSSSSDSSIERTHSKKSIATKSKNFSQDEQITHHNESSDEKSIKHKENNSATETPTDTHVKLKPDNVPLERSSSIEKRFSPIEERSSPAEERSSPTKERSSPTKEKSSPTKERSSPTEERSSPTEKPSEEENASNKSIEKKSSSHSTSDQPDKPEPVEKKEEKSETSYKPRKVGSSNRKLNRKSSEDNAEPLPKKQRWGKLTYNQKSDQSISVGFLKKSYPDFKLLSETSMEIDQDEHSLSTVDEKNGVAAIDDAPNENESSMKREPTSQMDMDREDSVPKDSNIDDDAVDPGTVSKIIFIQNLVRPFTLNQLKELLKQNGNIVEEYFWIDKIKSKCFVMYETEKEAIKARNALHNTRWPISNPKILSVEFSTIEELENHQQGNDVQPPKPPEPPAVEPPEMFEARVSHTAEEHKRKDRERRKEKDRAKFQAPVREWDKDKIIQDSPERERFTREEKSRSSEKKEKKESKKRATEDTPAKLLDDLFQKTKSVPCIYWLPLTEEQAKVKEEERKARRLEREKRTQQLREQEEAERRNRRARSSSRRREKENRKSSTRSRSPVSRRR